jgi:hypothetical protein
MRRRHRPRRGHALGFRPFARNVWSVWRGRSNLGYVKKLAGGWYQTKVWAKYPHWYGPYDSQAQAARML